MTGRGGLDLMQLRTFLAVYRAGSVTAAARLVGLSQPTVTTQLQELEKRLGRQLFERLPRGVAPTMAAEELAGRLAGPLDALEAIVGGGVDAPAAQPPVQLAGPAEMLGALALPALAPLLGRGVRLTVTTGLAEDLLTGLRAGQYDLVISTVRPRGRAVRAEPLMDEEFVLVAAPAVAAGIDPIELRFAGTESSSIPLVSYAADLPILRRYWRHVFGVRLDAEPAVVVADLRAVAALVAAGGGVSVLPRYLVAAQLDSGALVALLEPEEAPINTAFLARRVGSPALAHVDLVHEALLAAGRRW
ncbi:LysR family transcriptional regulator [Nocardia pseudobrasiliensis]|uniref:DNA-binding transcriptional LysR family regulator n=1 Tax=Nocardia pseudobrasiliensis TaxID=45979 RepID=A0A370I129_9NOCA|nr:LysR family transcriptional regulator [Nocardia pseudobrasiliensis]RDI62944.1 DNA-binding transcriptional LysR family regulator [Nocardia pseudobrasiliensis]